MVSRPINSKLTIITLRIYLLIGREYNFPIYGCGQADIAATRSYKKDNLKTNIYNSDLNNIFSREIAFKVLIIKYFQYILIKFDKSVFG